MDKDIQITIKGVQKNPDAAPNIDINSDDCYVDESTEKGSYYNKNGTHFVLTEDEFSARTARYKFNHRYLEVVKNGDINTKLYFEAGKSITSIYKTPAGRMSLTFNTYNYSLHETAERIDVFAEYSIYNEDVHVSNNTIELHINPAN